MGFIPPWLSQLIGDSQFNACVERIIRDIEEDVWNRVAKLAPGMSHAEARGYVRARSTMAINHRLDIETSAAKYPKYRTRLFERVQEKVIANMIVRSEDATSEVTTIPIHSMRRAA